MYKEPVTLLTKMGGYRFLLLLLPLIYETTVVHWIYRGVVPSRDRITSDAVMAKIEEKIAWSGSIPRLLSPYDLGKTSVVNYRGVDYGR